MDVDDAHAVGTEQQVINAAYHPTRQRPLDNPAAEMGIQTDAFRHKTDGDKIGKVGFEAVHPLHAAPPAGQAPVWSCLWQALCNWPGEEGRRPPEAAPPPCSGQPPICFRSGPRPPSTPVSTRQ